MNKSLHSYAFHQARDFFRGVVYELRRLEHEIQGGPQTNAAAVMEKIHPLLQRMGLLAQRTEDGKVTAEIPSEVLRKALTEGGLREKLRDHSKWQAWKTWTSAPEDWNDSPHGDCLLMKNLKGRS